MGAAIINIKALRPILSNIARQYAIALAGAMLAMGGSLFLNPFHPDETEQLRQVLDRLLIAFVSGNGVALTALLASEMAIYAEGRRRLLLWIAGTVIGFVVAGVTWFVVQVMQVQILNGDTFGEALVWLFVLFPYFDNVPILLWGALGLSTGFAAMMPLYRHPALQIIGTTGILTFALTQANALNPITQGIAANWCCGLIDFASGMLFVPLLFAMIIAISVHMGRYYAIR